MTRLAVGAMRLSTGDRDDDRSIAVLHAAFDAGITLVDSADAYCHDAADAGHNERLIARALETWSGDRSTIRVATKGGLTRPDGRWVPDGRAKHLAAAGSASRLALGVDRIHLYQLHAVDPRTPLSTSVRALAALQRDGVVDSIGLCNVNVTQIEEARTLAEIASVQVEVSVWKDDNILNGVAGYCVANRISLLAYRPLGGPERARRLASDPTLREVAAKHGVSACEAALAWLMHLSDLIVPVVGVTRVETARALGPASGVVFDEEDWSRLDARFPSGRSLRSGASHRTDTVPQARDGDVILIMGLPGAGKSTIAQSFVADGYARLNRDTTGGSLSGLLPAIDDLVTAGTTRMVLDNTYLSRESRARVIAAAAAHGLPVRCLFLDTAIEDAQVNAVQRMIRTLGHLPDPEELRRASKRDPTIIGPGVQFRCKRELEAPHPSEGFSAIERVPFERQRRDGSTNRALILWIDDVPQHAGEVLRRYMNDGWRLLGLSWQPGIAEKTTTEDAVRTTFARTQEALGVSIEIAYCPHPAGPPICWCRKPLPGLGVVFIERYELDPPACLYVATGSQDPGFARRLGFQFRRADEFFGAL